MNHVGLQHYLVVSFLLFALGLFGVIIRRNVLVIYMCLELMLNAANLALVAFSRFNNNLDGQVIRLFHDHSGRGGSGGRSGVDRRAVSQTPDGACGRFDDDEALKMKKHRTSNAERRTPNKRVRSRSMFRVRCSTFDVPIDELSLLPWIILFLPLAAAAVITLFTQRNRQVSATLSVGAVVVGFILIGDVRANRRAGNRQCRRWRSTGFRSGRCKLISGCTSIR